jgi:hypothetical protein
VYHHAGHPLEAIDRSKGHQSCQSGFNFWKRKNRFITNPQPGTWDHRHTIKITKNNPASWRDKNQTKLKPKIQIV